MYVLPAFDQKRKQRCKKMSGVGSSMPAGGAAIPPAEPGNAHKGLLGQLNERWSLEAKPWGAESLTHVDTSSSNAMKSGLLS